MQDAVVPVVVSTNPVLQVDTVVRTENSPGFDPRMLSAPSVALAPELLVRVMASVKLDMPTVSLPKLNAGGKKVSADAGAPGEIFATKALPSEEAIWLWKGCPVVANTGKFVE